MIKHIEENTGGPAWVRQRSLGRTQKTWIIKEKYDKKDVTKIKDFFFQKVPLRQWKHKPPSVINICKTNTCLKKFVCRIPKNPQTQ